MSSAPRSTSLWSGTFRAPHNKGRDAAFVRRIDAECSQPIRSAITDAGILGNDASNARICGSASSANRGLGARSYLGGSTERNAARTVFRDIPRRRATSLIERRSERCNRRISAQSSTLITPQEHRRGSEFPRVVSRDRCNTPERVEWCWKDHLVG